uniref:Apple domain-containing protein n=1 Tax=viral metagenome TaxID=1070528 RepID=A0A6C0KYJ5_9ZZZZ
MSSTEAVDKMDSSILKLQSLEAEYDLVMTQYRQAYLDYISSLQTINTENNGQGRQFDTLQGRRFWGTSGIKDLTVASTDECIASCAGDLNCTGASFNLSSGYCWLRTGDGDVTVSNNNDEYALMPSISQNTNNLKMLNDKLIRLNVEIMNELNSTEPTVFREIETKNEKKTIMENRNEELLKEKAKILKSMGEYEDLTAQYDSNSIYVRQANAEYILWTILAVTIIVIIIKMVVTPQSRGSDHIKFALKLILGFVFLVTLTKLDNPSAYAIFGVFVIVAIFVVSSSASGSGSGSSSYGASSSYNSPSSSSYSSKF